MRSPRVCREDKRISMEPWDILTLGGGETGKNQQKEQTVNEVDGKPRLPSWKPGEESSQTRGND